MFGHKPHSLENQDRIFEKDKNFIWHYTCNSPKLDILKNFNIIPIGDKYGCYDIREVLLIPINLYLDRFGEIKNEHLILSINCQILLRDIKRNN